MTPHRILRRALWLGLLVALAGLPEHGVFGASPRAAESRLDANPDVASAIGLLDRWIQDRVLERDEPGLAIGIIHGQELVWAKGYGLADRARHVSVTPATLFRIASLSKIFTATAIMQLRDAGKLHLDDPVGQYLPWFRVTESAPGTPPITIRDLLTHTSGLPRELPMSYWNDLHFPTREQMIGMFPLAATFPPETVYKYSNLGLAVAGEVVAAVSGEPYPAYIQQHVLTPLGMTATRVTPTSDTPGLAIGYRKRVPGEPREVEDFIDARGLTPAANLASNVEDLARLVAFELRKDDAAGPGILRTSSVREMQRVEWLQDDWQAGQGLGFWIRHVGQEVRVGHDGAAPGFKSQIEFSPKTGFGVVVLINGYDAHPLTYADEAFSIVEPVIERVTRRPPAPAHADAAWQQYVGRYTWKHVSADIRILDGELTMTDPDAANPAASRVRLLPVSTDTFRIVGGGLNGELLRFERDAQGAITRLVAGSYYRLRERDR